MTIKERFGLVTLTLAAAFAGGSVSGHIFAARAVDAANAPHMITAQKFMLVDSHGKTAANSMSPARASHKSPSSTAPAPCAPASASAPTAPPHSASTATTASRAPKSASPIASLASCCSTPMRPPSDPRRRPRRPDRHRPDGQGRNPRASIIVQADGTPTLRLGDKDRGRIGMDMTPDGRPGLALLGPDGKTRASLTLNTDGAGALTLFDATGNPVNSVP